MSNKTENKMLTLAEKSALVPKRRFPEFRDAEEWKIQPFKKLFSIGNGKDYKHLSAGNVPVYGSGGYMLSVDEYLYSGESVCIGRKGTINNPIFLTGKFWTVDTLFYTHSFNECLPKFIYVIFQGINWLKHNEAGGVPSLSKANIEKIEIAVPKPAEQQKIAACFSSIDELITLEGQKLDLLKTHKKGLMQQLFPAEGETLPQLRFPEFRDTGEWEKKRLGEVAPFQRGFDLPSDQIKPGTIPVVYSNGIGNFHNVGMAKGPGLVTGRSGTIGKIHFIEEGDYWPHNTSLWVTSFQGHFPKFVYYLYTSIGMNRFASGSGVPTLNRNDVHAHNTYVPPSIDEQKKIADCLSHLDSLLITQTQKINALTIHKRGLMQQLFPVLDGAPA